MWTKHHSLEKCTEATARIWCDFEFSGEIMDIEFAEKIAMLLFENNGGNCNSLSCCERNAQMEGMTARFCKDCGNLLSQPKEPPSKEA